MKQGPVLGTLLRRMTLCPPVFLEEPRIGGLGRIDVAAMVADLLRAIAGHAKLEVDVSPWLAAAQTEKNRLQMVALACWLLADKGLRLSVTSHQTVQDFLGHGLDNLAQIVDAQALCKDEERREEFVRLCLSGLGLIPKGETVEQAEDRLATLSSAEQRSIVRDAAAAQRRAEEIRAALKQRAALNAAKGGGK